MKEIQIRNPQHLENWLRNKPLDWSQVIALRIALRAFPLVLSIADFPTPVVGRHYELNFHLLSWRTLLISWVARKYPSHDMVPAASFAAAAATATGSYVYTFSNAPADARAAAYAAIAAAETVSAEFGYNLAPTHAAKAATAADDAAAVAAADREQIWAAISADCRALATNSGSLIDQELWLADAQGDDWSEMNVPEWAREALKSFEKSDLVETGSWSIISAWYRALLPDRMGAKPRSLFGESADIEIAKQPDEFWKRDPQIVLEAIEEIVESARQSIEQDSYYNLIVSGIDGSWDGNSGTMLRGRYLEYTTDYIEAKFDPIERVYDQIINMPTILAYEAHHERSARVVRLSDLHISNPKELEFWFEPDERFAPISFEAMTQLRPQLGIEYAELNRTHWAIKAINLLDVLPIVDGYKIEEALDEAIENLEPQAPAAFRFGWSAEKIIAQPPSTFSPDSETAQDLLDDVRRKALTLAERLERSNAEKRVRDSLQGLIDVLAERVADLRPGLLRSRSRSIEADANAYSDHRDERELFPDAVAALIDLSETLRDLQGCFPQLRDIEAEIMALDIDPAKADDVKDNLDRIVDAISDHENVVDQSAIDALQTMEGIASEDASPAVKQKRIAEYALVVRNFMSPLARFALDNALSKAVTEATRDVWAKARPKIVDGVADGMGSMARPATIIAIASLVHLVFGPAAAIAAATAGFGKIDRLLKLVEKWLSKSSDMVTDEEEIEEGAEEADT